MSLDAQVSRVTQGTKDTLKALINKLGGTVTNETIDQYPELAGLIELPQDITGTTVSVTAKEAISNGNLVYLLVENGTTNAYLATNATDAQAYRIGIAQADIGVNGTGSVMLIAAVDLSAVYNYVDQGVQTDLTNHENNSVVHITDDERTAWNGKQDALTFDDTPTTKSNNPVTSGGVRSYVDGVVGDINSVLDSVNGEVI